jgi:hypothetical protein
VPPPHVHPFLGKDNLVRCDTKVRREAHGPFARELALAVLQALDLGLAGVRQRGKLRLRKASACA